MTEKEHFRLIELFELVRQCRRLMWRGSFWILFLCLLFLFWSATVNQCLNLKSWSVSVAVRHVVIQGH